MKIVYKYELKPDGWLILPEGSKFLHAKWKDEGIKAWFEIPAHKNSQEEVRILAVPTGMMFDPEGMEYLDTIHIDDEGLVFHLYRDTANHPIELPLIQV